MSQDEPIESNVKLTSRGPRVLIADDYPNTIASLERLLSSYCQIVGAVADCASVAEATTALHPDIVLLDLNLSGGNSLMVCREIRRVAPQAKVIVLTAGIDSSLRPDVLAAGAAAFIDKSAAATELLSAITEK